MAAPTCADFSSIILGALLLLFCCSIIYAVRRWLKTQAAAEIGAANEAMLHTAAEIEAMIPTAAENLMLHAASYSAERSIATYGRYS
jgi:hypothetical protein